MRWPLALALLGLLAALVCLGLSVGSMGWQPPWRAMADPLSAQIVWDVRAPRTAGCMLAGALLGLGGAVAQGLFRNALAEPYLLGSASGAALAMAVLLGLGGGVAADGALGLSAKWGLTGAAFVGALAGVCLTLLLARGAAHTLRLLLSGVVVGVVLGAFTQLMMMWSAQAWRVMQAFMLGNTALLDGPACAVMAVILMLCLPVSLALSRQLDALSLGEDTARSLGVSLGWTRLWLVAVVALSTAGAVAQAGLVSFVGLVAPHLVRPLTGARHLHVLWASALMGAALLLAADVLARWALAPQELPVGLFTAVTGGVYLLVVLHRRAR